MAFAAAAGAACLKDGLKNSNTLKRGPAEGTSTLFPLEAFGGKIQGTSI